MKKNISVLALAAALTFALTYGNIALAQPQSDGHFPGNHITKPDVPAGKDFKKPEGQHPGKEMRDNFQHDKKDFEKRVDQGKKDFKDKMKHDKKFDKRNGGKDFKRGEGRPDIGKPDHNPQPGDHSGAPDFGQRRQ